MALSSGLRGTYVMEENDDRSKTTGDVARNVANSQREWSSNE